MSTPEDISARNATTPDSSKAFVGGGVSAAALGVLFLLLGFAQSMRGQSSAAVILLSIGAVLVVVGFVVAGMAKSRKRR
jgi:membrane-bound ClpP family serine protease